jgi:hypothetical protein
VDLEEKKKEQKGGISSVFRDRRLSRLSRPRTFSFAFRNVLCCVSVVFQALTSKSDPFLGRCWCETVSAAHAVEEAVHATEIELSPFQ